MKRNRLSRGFTLIELLVVISIIAILAAGAYAGYGRLMPRIEANAAAQKAKQIYNLLQAYAQENDQLFPETDSFSNDAFRELFKKELVDSEDLFCIKKDPWTRNAPGGGRTADNEIGQRPDYAEALSPGECSWAYVTGLDTSDSTTLPIMANAFAPGGTRYAKKGQRGGVFNGLKAVWVNVGGSAQVEDLDTDLTIKKRKGGTEVDVFSNAYGTDPANVRNPAG